MLKSLVWKGGLYDLRRDERVVRFFAMHDGRLPGGREYFADNIRFVRVRDESERWLDFPVYESETSLGARTNLWRIFQKSLTFSHWDRLLVFEDDVSFLGTGSLLRMMTCPFLDDDGLITFHDMKELKPDSAYGLHRRHVIGADLNGFWGLQAVAFPRVVVEYLAWLNFKLPWWGNPRSEADRVVEFYLKNSRWPYTAVHCPPLVRHEGEVSAAIPGEALAARQAKVETPDDFDAGALVGRPEMRF